MIFSLLGINKNSLFYACFLYLQKTSLLLEVGLKLSAYATMSKRITGNFLLSLVGIKWFINLQNRVEEWFAQTVFLC